MAYKLLSEQELDALEGAINRGETDALKYLIKESKRVAKAANSRLLRLERNDFYESNAYQRATYYTDYAYGSERFRVNKSMDADALLEQYREMRTFMRKESSTIKGMRSQQSRLLDALESYDIHIPDAEKKTFFKFVNSDDVQDVMQLIPEYDVVMDAIANNFGKINNDLTDISASFRAFLEGEIFYDQLLERISGETYDSLYKRSRNRRIDYDARRSGRKRNS